MMLGPISTTHHQGILQPSHSLPHRLSLQGLVVGQAELDGQPQKVLGRCRLRRPTLARLAARILRLEDVRGGGSVRAEEVIVVVGEPVVASAVRAPPRLSLFRVALNHFYMMMK